MLFAFPVWDAEKVGCTFTESPDGTVTGILPAEENQPEVVVHGNSRARAAILLLFEKEERRRIVAAEAEKTKKK